MIFDFTNVVQEYYSVFEGREPSKRDLYINICTDMKLLSLAIPVFTCNSCLVVIKLKK